MLVKLNGLRVINVVGFQFSDIWWLSIFKGSAKAIISNLLCFKAIKSMQTLSFLTLCWAYKTGRYIHWKDVSQSPLFHLHHFLLVHQDRLVVPANKNKWSDFSSVQWEKNNRNPSSRIYIYIYIYTLNVWLQIDGLKTHIFY